MTTAADYVEIHRTSDRQEADRLIKTVLEPEGIEAVIHDRVDHALPAPDAQAGAYFIAVPESQRDKARALLDEFLSAGG